MKTILSREPLIYFIDDVLSDEECEYFINLGKPKLKQALVSGDNQGYKSQGRTGSNCWIEHNHDSITTQIHQRISDLVGYPAENAESYQLIHYDETQKYEYHKDSFPMTLNEKSKRCMSIGGQRLLTALVYLNNVEEGGETDFKNANVSISPKRGRMAVFENTQKGTLIPDEKSLHSGRPVIKGEKYAFNLWFRHLPRTQYFDLEKHLKGDVSTSKIIQEDIIKEEIVSEKTDNFEYMICKNCLSNEENKKIMDILDKSSSKKVNNRDSYWLDKSNFGFLVNKIEKNTNIPSFYYEGINVLKYEKGSGHGVHYDAYDITSNNGKKVTETRGNRIYTIIGNLSNNTNNNKIRFNQIGKEIVLNKNDIMIYKSCINSNDEKSQRNQLLNYTIDNMGVDSYYFYIFIREIFQNKKINANIDFSKFKKEEITTETVKNEEIDYRNTLIEFYNKIETSNIVSSHKDLIIKSEGVQSERLLLKLLSEKKGILKRELVENDYKFDEFNPVTVNNVFNEDIFSIIQQYYHEGIKNKNFVLGDRQSNRYKSYNEVVSRVLQYEILPLIEKITGESLKPTYTYLSAYTKEADLPPHTDREDCEFTVSFLIDKPEGTDFPIYVDLEKQPVKHKGRYEKKPDKSNCMKVDCEPNGLMMFSGTDHIHYREKLNTEYFITLLLHFRKN